VADGAFTNGRSTTASRLSQPFFLRIEQHSVIATWDLSLMPPIDKLRDRMQQVSALAAVFAVDYGGSQFEFHPRGTRNQQMAAMKDGCGDELFIHFLPKGCFIKGFAHESEMTPYKHDPPKLWPGMFDGVPPAFATSLNEPAFDIPATTFVIWRLNDQASWSASNVEYCDGEYRDGSADLLLPVSYTSANFTEWLAENYEVDVDQSIVDSVFDNKPLSDSALLTLNAVQPINALRDAVRATGYQLR